MENESLVSIHSKIIQLREMGLNISQISRYLKVSRNTIYKYINKIPCKSQEIRLRKKKLDRYHHEILEHIKSYTDISASQISNLLKKQFGDLGVSSGTVSNYVKMIREKYDLPKPVLDNSLE